MLAAAFLCLAAADSVSAPTRNLFGQPAVKPPSTSFRPQPSVPLAPVAPNPMVAALQETFSPGVSGHAEQHSAGVAPAFSPLFQASAAAVVAAVFSGSVWMTLRKHMNMDRVIYRSSPRAQPEGTQMQPAVFMVDAQAPMNAVESVTNTMAGVVAVDGGTAGLEVTFPAFLAVILGLFVPVVFLITLYIQSDAQGTATTFRQPDSIGGIRFEEE